MTPTATPGEFSYWPDDINVSVVGTADPDTILASVSSLVYLGQAAGVKVHFVNGLQGTRQGNLPAFPSNYLIVFQKSNDGTFAGVQALVEAETSRSGGLAHEVVDLLKGVPTKLADGCLAGMTRTDKQSGKIAAFVAIVGSELSAEVQRACLGDLAPMSLGILPVEAKHELFLGPDKKRVLVRDQSETVLDLIAQQACRIQAGEFDIQCPAAIVKNLMKSHATLVDQ